MGKISRQSVLEQALEIVTVDRNSQYGEPEDNFQTIAELWSVYLTRRTMLSVELNASDVAVLMALMKIGRLTANKTHADSWTDGIGYLACGAEIACRE
jgi:hypothetical protein